MDQGLLVADDLVLELVVARFSYLTARMGMY